MGVKEEIEQASAAADKAWKDKSVKNVLDMYCEDTFGICGGQAVNGKKAMEGMMKEMVSKKDMVFTHKIECVVAMSDNWAMEKGKFTLDKSEGSYVVIWKKDGGKWKIAVECTNAGI